MSEFSKALEREVHSTVTTAWESRDGKIVPESEDLKMANDRVILDAVLLYADLADSTEMAVNNQEIAAEVFKSYLRGVTRIIEANGGAVRSFDGDRAMGVFIGDYKNSNAAKCGLQINWFFRTALTAQFRSVYTTSVQGFNFDQTVGIDRSSVHVARAGVRDNNDLIWVGRAPNVAAKLSSVRDKKYKTFITAGVYKALTPDSKINGTPKRDMWTALTWKAGEPYGTSSVYGSEWTWTP